MILVSLDHPQTPGGTEILNRALRVHCARTKDVVLRRSSNEFAAILPNTPPAGARRVGEQIVEAMRSASSDHEHRVSVGIAVTVPDNHRNPDEFARRAESALLASQDNGGDRCTGGAATGMAPGQTTNGPLALLRGLIPKRVRPADQKRRTD